MRMYFVGITQITVYKIAAGFASPAAWFLQYYKEKTWN